MVVRRVKNVQVTSFESFAQERKDRILKVVAMFNGGATVLEIARALDMRASTVSTDMQHARAAGISCPHRTPARANMTGQNVMAGVMSKRKAAQAALENEFKPRTELPVCENPVRFMDLKPNCCKWPAVLDYGKTNADSLFCGERVADVGQPWCEAHRAIAWTGQQGMSEGLRGQRMDKTVKRCEVF